ncbi:LON peptidase substrate-binding domain-containing protein [Rhodoligotrophos defluvii]|uniref:LON peptidase substrate-binding domain-containing protein n=1 Tax=Rhodoligotrophos defluvii TaxID=2561934 RepID=UPI0010C98BD5|nr:LON peptidase substrate-binding domain-containing protein [Rhodoligotrophos defluvii]
MAGPTGRDRIDDLPKRLPIFPLGGVLLLPRGELPLNIFEPRYLRMVTDAIRSERMIGMVQPDTVEGRRLERDPRAAPTVYPIGCAGRITAFSETEDGRMLIVLTGVCRFRIAEELPQGERPYRVAIPDYSPFGADLEVDDGDIGIDRQALLRAFDEFLAFHDLQADWSDVAQASDEALINALAMISPYSPEEKQALLEAADLKARAQVLTALTDIGLAEKRGGLPPVLQ